MSRQLCIIERGKIMRQEGKGTTVINGGTKQIRWDGLINISSLK